MNSTMHVAPAIRVRGLEKSYPRVRGVPGVLLCSKVGHWLARCLHLRCADKKTVFKDLQFEIPCGSITALLGSNAAGKTTLLRCLAGFSEPDEGDILIHGHSRGSISAIAMMSSDELYDQMTAIELLTFIAKLHRMHVEHAIRMSKELLMALGVTEEMYSRDLIEMLSKGSRAKVAVVAAVMSLLREDRKEPGILLLDEPTLGFDIVSKRDFFEALRQLHERFPELTIVIGTNELDEAQLCDGLLMIEGRGVVRKPVLQAELPTPTMREELRKAFEQLYEGRECTRGSFQLQKVPVQRSSIVAAFLYRAWRDFRRHPDISALLVLSLVLPNILALFAAVQTRGTASAFLTWGLAVFATLMMREATRLLDRERSFYLTLRQIDLSPVTRFEHMYSATIVSLLFQAGYTIVTMVLMFLLLGCPVEVVEGFAQLRIGECLGVLAVVSGIILAILGISLITTHIPLAFTMVQAAFLVPIVPLLMLLFSGLYFSPDSLPLPLQLLSECNPISYGAYSFSGFFGFEPVAELRAVQWLTELTGLSRLWAALLIEWFLAVLLFVLGALCYPTLEHAMRRANRI